MNVYIAVVADRHTDTAYTVFADATAAIDYARRAFRETVAHPGEIREQTVEGYEYYARYIEEDYACVVKRMVR